LGKGSALLGEGMFILTWWLNEGAPLLQRTRPFGKGLFQSVTMNFNLLIQHTVSRWCSSGCVHEGCGGVDRWLQTDHWVSQISFYRQPIRQASTKCPLPPLKQLNFLMQISSQLSRFPNSNNDHCDLGFIVITCDVVRRPYRGHEAAIEDSMSKRGGGVCGPPMLGMGGEDESADGAGRWGRFQAMWGGGGKFG
jgi:hypothetical protein